MLPKVVVGRSLPALNVLVVATRRSVLQFVAFRCVCFVLLVLECALVLASLFVIMLLVPV